MRINNLISFTYILFAAAIIAIGRIYDERLELLGLNFSVFISGFFILLSCIMIISIRSIKLTSTRALFYMFLCIILFSPILWGFYDFIDYGIEKYLNFSILIIPLLLIILEKFSYNDINNFFNVLIWFIVVLALVSFSIVQESNERLSVFGGGPIIFARWMLIGIFILFFTNKYKKRKLSWLLMCMFFVLSLAAGSKGPILALLMTFSIYFFLNFQKLIIKIFAIIIILFSFTQFIDNWDTWGQEQILHENTDLAFSPKLTWAAQMNYKFNNRTSLLFNSKYVGEQFIDNTSSEDRKIDDYWEFYAFV